MIDIEVNGQFLTRWVMRDGHDIEIDYAETDDEQLIPSANVRLSNISGGLNNHLQLRGRVNAALSYSGREVIRGHTIPGEWQVDRDQLTVTMPILHRHEERKAWLEQNLLKDLIGSRQPTQVYIYGAETGAGVDPRFMWRVNDVLRAVISTVYSGIPDTIWVGGTRTALFGLPKVPETMTGYEFIKLVADTFNCIWYFNDAGLVIKPRAQYLAERRAEGAVDIEEASLRGSAKRLEKVPGVFKTIVKTRRPGDLAENDSGIFGFVTNPNAQDERTVDLDINVARRRADGAAWVRPEDSVLWMFLWTLSPSSAAAARRISVNGSSPDVRILDYYSAAANGIDGFECTVSLEHSSSAALLSKLRTPLFAVNPISGLHLLGNAYHVARVSLDSMNRTATITVHGYDV